jgi:hypothetical protein
MIRPSLFGCMRETPNSGGSSKRVSADGLIQVLVSSNLILLRWGALHLSMKCLHTPITLVQRAWPSAGNYPGQTTFRSLKMAALGLWIGGTAHRINSSNHVPIGSRMMRPE